MTTAARVLPPLLCALGALGGEPSAFAADIPFAFDLDKPALTSAGVYDPTGIDAVIVVGRRLAQSGAPAALG